MAQDTLLGFPAHTLPYRRREFATLSTVSFKQIISQRTLGGETRMVEFVPKSRHSCRGT